MANLAKTITDKVKHYLKNLTVKELSLVDRGANQGAKVVLFKHENTNDDIINSEKSMKEDLDMKLEDVLNEVKKILDPLAEKVNALEKASAADPDPVVEPTVEPVKEEPKEVVAPVDENLVKALKTETEIYKIQLEDLRKEFETVKKASDELKAQREKAEIEKKIEKEFPYLQGTMEQKVELYKSLADNEFGLQVLKSTNDANKKMFRSTGHSNSIVKSADQKLEDLAKSLQEKDASLSLDQAIDKALNTPAGQKLYAESVNQGE